jgi:hypothetical protein
LNSNNGLEYSFVVLEIFAIGWQNLEQLGLPAAEMAQGGYAGTTSAPLRVFKSSATPHPFLFLSLKIM